MRFAFIPVLLFAMLAASAVDAQGTIARQILRLTPKTGGQTTGAAFTAHCTDVLRLVGANSSFSFLCKTTEGPTRMFTIAKGEDNTGTYAVGHDSQTGNALSNLYGANAISQVVVAFVMVKTVNPASSAVLELQGFASKLPAANGAPVVTAATLIMN